MYKKSTRYLKQTMKLTTNDRWLKQTNKNQPWRLSTVTVLHYIYIYIKLNATLVISFFCLPKIRWTFLTSVILISKFVCFLFCFTMSYIIPVFIWHKLIWFLNRCIQTCLSTFGVFPRSKPLHYFTFSEYSLHSAFSCIHKYFNKFINHVPIQNL